jgi:predicted ATP-binding protein involved in virulence
MFAMKDKRKAYEEKLDAQLEEWNAQIALLKAKSDKGKAEAKIEYYKTIGALQHKQDEARTKLHELKTAGDERHGKTSKQAQKRPGMKSRQPSTSRPQSSNEQGRWTHRSDV